MIYPECAECEYWRQMHWLGEKTYCCEQILHTGKQRIASKDNCLSYCKRRKWNGKHKMPRIVLRVRQSRGQV